MLRWKSDKMKVVKNMTVNQMVAGSSPAEGAKPRNIARFSLFMYYIYILYSLPSDKFYLGYSNDPWSRVIQHNTDPRNTFSSKHRPWKLAAVFSVGAIKSDALIIERWIKKQNSRKLLEKLINPELIPTGKLAQLVRVPHVRD